MNKTIIAVAVMQAATVGILGFAAFAGAAGADPDVYDQRNFPCQEDEVLGYSPDFGPDKVGCIHIDNLLH